MHVFGEGKFLAPVITWGKYEMDRGKCVMPATMNLHYAVADGFHISRFFIEAQELMDSLRDGAGGRILARPGKGRGAVSR